MTEHLGARIRAKLTPDEIAQLQNFDKDALRALDKAIIETAMPDASRHKLRALIQDALADHEP